MGPGTPNVGDGGRRFKEIPARIGRAAVAAQRASSRTLIRALRICAWRFTGNLGPGGAGFETSVAGGFADEGLVKSGGRARSGRRAGPGYFAPAADFFAGLGESSTTKP